MAKGTELKSKLDANVQKFNDGLDELVRVLGGDQAGAYDPADVWPDSDIDATVHANKVLTDLKAAPFDSDLNATIKKLLDGVPASDTIQTAVDAVIAAVESVVKEAGKLSDQIGAGDRVAAFNELNKPHAEGTYGTANFGFFRALGGVITAGGGSADLDSALAPLAAVAGAIEAGDAYLIFTNYALGALDLLKRAFVF